MGRPMTPIIQKAHDYKETGAPFRKKADKGHHLFEVLRRDEAFGGAIADAVQQTLELGDISHFEQLLRDATQGYDLDEDAFAEFYRDVVDYVEQRLTSAFGVMAKTAALRQDALVTKLEALLQQAANVEPNLLAYAEILYEIDNVLGLVTGNHMLPDSFTSRLERPPIYQGDVKERKAAMEAEYLLLQNGMKTLQQATSKEDMILALQDIADSAEDLLEFLSRRANVELFHATREEFTAHAEQFLPLIPKTALTVSQDDIDLIEIRAKEALDLYEDDSDDSHLVSGLSDIQELVKEIMTEAEK